jgi:HAD superfamily hydrolase (TIGR01549 family)
MHPNHTLNAIIWDYDNTLVDTRLKNYKVTRKIIEDVTGKNADDFPFLASLEGYLNSNSLSPSWRYLYRHELGLSEEQTDIIGRLWTDYQRNDQTPVSYFPGIGSVLETLQDLPQGIVSQNSRESISKALQQAGWLKYFKDILGYEEVNIRKQKPHPDGLLSCLELMGGMQPGVVLSIGDHETDIQASRNANIYFEENQLGIQVVSVWAAYGSFGDHSTWKINPDYVAKKTEEILDIIHGL